MLVPALDSSTRELLSNASRAAFTNPFGPQRDELDSVLSGRKPEDPEVLDAAVSRVSECMRKVRAKGRLPSGGRDAELIEHAALFEVFHRVAGPMDEFIEQERHSGQAQVVPFASELLQHLSSVGFSEPRAHRMVALFYQMRRAWYFIGRSMIGSAPSMRRLRESLWNAVFTRDIRLYERHLWNRMEDFSTILLGETGTGKGAAAAAIGQSGFVPYDPKRERFASMFSELFVPLNLSQFPEALIESELFGHRKGAFTGAVDTYQGAFARCSTQGSVFLDEIGEVSTPVQIKLLRVLQERTYTPVGSHESSRFEGRVIAATNRDLAKARADGSFRDDFFYRLSSHVVVMPTLRTRLSEDPAELGRLVRSLIHRLVGELPSSGDRDSDSAADWAVELRQTVLQAIDRDLGDDYAWPGNVRELEQAVRRVLLTGACPTDPRDRPGSTLAEEIHEGALSAEELVARYCQVLYDSLGTYAEVARRTGLDRRTVKKHVVRRDGDANQ